MRAPYVPLSTWPFADDYPWDDELIRAGRRALSTHGPWQPTAQVKPSPGTKSGAAIRGETSGGQ
jgi:hypothetical protein